jgi:hypothetical protein
MYNFFVFGIFGADVGTLQIMKGKNVGFLYRVSQKDVYKLQYGILTLCLYIFLGHLYIKYEELVFQTSLQLLDTYISFQSKKEYNCLIKYMQWLIFHKLEEFCKLNCIWVALARIRNILLSCLCFFTISKMGEDDFETRCACHRSRTG